MLACNLLNFKKNREEKVDKKEEGKKKMLNIRFFVRGTTWEDMGAEHIYLLAWLEHILQTKSDF